ncbi:hypothetical protein JZ751_007804 [Albula glossodonta]|uniref:Uncharacterized protein n=1 Tax=Albula glossodonta TaxID=121402 RepID=A0A8T2P0Y0_9TELE|nr:hypothetical protein JZ751_007804 [Albula glossodonta]
MQCKSVERRGSQTNRHAALKSPAAFPDHTSGGALSSLTCHLRFLQRKAPGMPPASDEGPQLATRIGLFSVAIPIRQCWSEAEGCLRPQLHVWDVGGGRGGWEAT